MHRLLAAVAPASVLACALAFGACDDGSQTSPTPTVTPGSISVSPAGLGLAGATPYTFTATGFVSSNGEPLTYRWDFGDRTTATGGSTITHTYMIDWYVFKTTVTASVASGASAQATLDGIRVTAAVGRWGVRAAGGMLVFGSTFLAQNEASLHGDETWPSCRFDVTGSVVAPRAISLTYTRSPTNCDAVDMPASLTFTGVADESISRFQGTLTPGGPATLVKCAAPFNCQ